jgi:acyl-[acyl-carrier-protein]-phospholipid O-acyltransferase / long-chain-fatty-acid--[acyl-carrier-protein] ligase
MIRTRRFCWEPTRFIYANPYDFHNIRFAVAGAEKLKDSTRQLYADKFGVSIMQGYGVTETSPVLSCNTFLYQKTGSVGRFFPAIEWRLEAVEVIPRGGRLWVKGPNVMLGYMKIDKMGVVQPQGEWYDTGDIVDVDAEGFITILGRAKRFAKIAGEMVSLAALEEFVARVAPDVAHAAIAIPDARKGEQIVLFTESNRLTRSHLIDTARAEGVAEITLPKQLHVVAEIPRLGSGKIDYPALAQHPLVAKPSE